MLNHRDLLDKHLLRLGKELRALYRRSQIRITLDEPLQRGWCRFHVMTEKAERRDDRETLRTILKSLGTVCLRRTPDFCRKRGKGHRRKFVVVDQPLKVIEAGRWVWLEWPEAWKSYFDLKVRRCNGRTYETLVFASPYLFELKIEPNLVTELYVPDPEVQQRIAEVERWLEHHHAMPRLQSLQGHRYHWRNPWQKPPDALLNRVAARELRQAMQNPQEADPAASARSGRISLLAKQTIFRSRSPRQRQRT